MRVRAPGETLFPQDGPVYLVARRETRYNGAYGLNELYIRNRACAEKGGERHMKILLADPQLKIFKRI